MRFKYKKIIITASFSVMLIGMVIFSTKRSVDTKAENNKAVEFSKEAETSNSLSTDLTGSAGSNLAVSNEDNTVSSGGISAENTENAQGISLLMKNAYPEVNKVVEEYLQARLKVDKDAITKLVDNVYYAGIEELPQMMKNFDSIRLIDCYTIDGPEDNAKMVYARTETKIKGIDTPASSIDGFYVRTDENGVTRIILSPLTDEIQKIIDEDVKREDVSALLSEVNTRFAHEIKSDKKLADFFTKLQNRQAGSDEDISVTESTKEKKKDSGKAKGTTKKAKSTKKSSKSKKSN